MFRGGGGAYVEFRQTFEEEMGIVDAEIANLMSEMSKLEEEGTMTREDKHI